MSGNIRDKEKHWVCSSAELEKDGRRIVEIGGIEIGLFLVNGHVIAWRNLCPHAAAPVCEGRVCGTRLDSDVYEYIYGRDREILRCPWHGWEFQLTTGEHLGQSGLKLRGYEAGIEDGRVYVMASSHHQRRGADTSE